MHRDVGVAERVDRGAGAGDVDGGERVDLGQRHRDRRPSEVPGQDAAVPAQQAGHEGRLADGGGRDQESGDAVVPDRGVADGVEPVPGKVGGQPEGAEGHEHQQGLQDGRAAQQVVPGGAETQDLEDADRRGRSRPRTPGFPGHGGRRKTCRRTGSRTSSSASAGVNQRKCRGRGCAGRRQGTDGARRRALRTVAAAGGWSLVRCRMPGSPADFPPGVVLVLTDGREPRCYPAYHGTGRFPVRRPGRSRQVDSSAARIRTLGADRQMHLFAATWLAIARER